MRKLLPVSLAILSVAFGAACDPKNMLGRPVVATESHVYTFQGDTYSYIEGTSLDDREADPLRRPNAYHTRPVAIFIEGDGSECQAYSEQQWAHFVHRFSGDYVLVRAKTYVNVTCGTERFEKFDFLTRLDELDAIVKDVVTQHPGQPIILLGQSAGATLAALYADKHTGDVAAIVNLGGSVETLDLVIKQAERERHLDNRSLRENEENLDAAIQESTAGTSPDKAMWKRTEKFWGQMFSTKVHDVWLKLTIPVLVVHGQDDVDVPFDLMPRAKREFKRANKTNFTFEFEEGVGHDLLTNATFHVVNDWVTKNVQGKEKPNP